MSDDAITTALDPFPSAGLSLGPAPLYEMRRLSARLGHQIFILREDLTGFGLGGNKVRKLDYLAGDAVARGAGALVTSGASAFSRNAAAAGRVCGLEVHVVIAGSPATHNPASAALFQQLDCTLHYVDALEGATELVCDQLRAAGKVVYPLHPGGSDEIGALGYVDVFGHIVQFSENSGIHFDKIIAPTGSTGTHVGLLLGQLISGYDTRLIGVAVSQRAEVQRERIRALAAPTAKMLGVDLDESKIIVDDRFLGPGYPHPSEAGDAAARTFAHTEGLLLDRVYTGKAAAGLLHHATNGELDAGDRVLFIHTGGNAGLYY